MKHKVVILQEYVPQYRLAFFEKLIDLGHSQDISIIVGAGNPSGTLNSRSDSAQSPLVKQICQREYRIFGMRLVFRKHKPLTHDADMVIVEQARRNIDSYKALLPLRRGKLLAVWGHGKDYVSKSTLVHSLLRRWLTNSHDWFFGYTKSGVEAVVNEGFPREKTTNVENSIDTVELMTNLAMISEIQVERFLREHSLGSKTALYIGGLDESKRIDFLLESACYAHGLDADFQLVVVGNGMLRSMVESAASKHAFITYVGPVFGIEKALIFKACSVITMPGRVGLVSVDSFATGTPIITTDWPWHAPEFDYLSPGINAVVTSNSIESYAVELISLLNDPERLSSIRSSALKLAGRYTIESMANNFMNGIIAALDTNQAIFRVVTAGPNRVFSKFQIEISV